MSEQSGAYLDIQKGDEVKHYDLKGKAGYSIDLPTATVRIWDEETTRIVGTAFLVEFCYPNRT